MTEPLLVMHQASFLENGRTVHAVDVAVHAGDFVVVTGPESSGKTLLLRGALGLIAPHRGRVLLFGVDPAKDHHDAVTDARGRVAFASDKAPLLANMTLRDNLAVPLLMRSLSIDVVRASVDEMIDHFELRPFSDRRPHEITSRAHRAALLARAMLQPVDFLILDEPLQDALTDHALRVRHMAGAALLIAAQDAGRFPNATRTVALPPPDPR